MTITTPAPTSSGPSEADKVAIATLTQKVIAAWAYHDAAAFAGVFTEDGTMIIEGQYHKGRAAIQAYMEEAFTGKWRGSQVTGKPIDLRFLSDDVALLLTQGGALLPGETEVAEDGAIRASWTAVRVDGQWQLAAYQNTPRFGDQR
jgi:uncharacterized protein (TIGR02246 family)